MKSSRLLSVLLLSVLLFAVATAASVVGSWKGKVVLDTSKMKKALNAAEQQRQQQMINSSKSLALTLVFKKDGTYSATATGAPQGTTDSGKWSQSGNTITVTSSRKLANGTPSKPESFTMSANGKMLSMPLPGTNMGVTGKIIFTR
jgi:hypothetical protein